MAAVEEMTVIKQEPVSPTTFQPGSAMTWTRDVDPPPLSANDNTQVPMTVVNPIKEEVNTDWENACVPHSVVASLNVTPSLSTIAGNASIGTSEPQNNLYQHDAFVGSDMKPCIPVLLNNKTVGSLALGTNTLSISMDGILTTEKDCMKLQMTEKNLQKSKRGHVPCGLPRKICMKPQRTVTNFQVLEHNLSRCGRSRIHTKTSHAIKVPYMPSHFKHNQPRKICMEPQRTESNSKLPEHDLTQHGQQRIRPKHTEVAKEVPHKPNSFKSGRTRKICLKPQMAETNLLKSENGHTQCDMPGKICIKPLMAESNFHMHKPGPARHSQLRKILPNITKEVLHMPEHNFSHHDQPNKNQLQPRITRPVLQVSEHGGPITICVQPQMKETNTQIAEKTSTVNSTDQGIPMIESYYSLKKMTLKEMMELLDSGYDITNFFKADSQDYKRALTFCEAAKKHNVNSIHSGIDDAFFESLVSPHITEFEIALFKADIKNTLKLGGDDQQQNGDIDLSINIDDSNSNVGCVEKMSDNVSSDKNGAQSKGSTSEAMSLDLKPSVGLDVANQSDIVSDSDRMIIKRETDESPISENVTEKSDQLMEEERIKRVFTLSTLQAKSQGSTTKSSEILSQVKQPFSETSAVKSLVKHGENISKTLLSGTNTPGSSMFFGCTSNCQTVASVSCVSPVTHVPQLSVLTSSIGACQSGSSKNQDSSISHTDEEPTVNSEESEFDQEETIELDDATRFSYRKMNYLPKWNHSIIQLFNFDREVDELCAGPLYSGSNLFYCYLCHYTSVYSKSVYEHIAEVHWDPETREKSKQSYVCSHCCLRLPDLATLEMHELHYHLSSFPCYFCGIAIHTRQKLLQHVYDCHCQQIFNCPTCGVQLIGIHELLNHLRVQKHLSPLKSEGCICLYCDHICADFSHLSKHMTEYHINKPVPNTAERSCHSCRHIFMDDQALTVHKSSNSKQGKYSANYSLASVISKLNSALLSELNSCNNEHTQSENNGVFRSEWSWWKSYLCKVKDIVRTVSVDNNTFSYPYGGLVYSCKVRQASEDIVEKLPMALDKLVQITMNKFKQLQNMNKLTLNTSVLDMLSIVSVCEEFLKFLKSIDMVYQFELICLTPSRSVLDHDPMILIRGTFYEYPYREVLKYCAVENVNIDVLPGIFDGLLRLVFEKFPRLDPQVCFKFRDFWQMVITVSRTPLFTNLLLATDFTPFQWNKRVKRHINSFLYACDIGKISFLGIDAQSTISKCVLSSFLCDNDLQRQIFDLRFWESMDGHKDIKSMHSQIEKVGHDKDCMVSGNNMSANVGRQTKEQERRLCVDHEKSASNFMINVRTDDDADKKSPNRSVTRTRKSQRNRQEENVDMHHELERACKIRKVCFGSKARNIETVVAAEVLPSCIQNSEHVKCSIVVLETNAMAEELAAQMNKPRRTNCQRNIIRNCMKKKHIVDRKRRKTCNTTGSQTNGIIKKSSLNVAPIFNEVMPRKSLRLRKREISYYESDQTSAESDSDDDLSALDNNKNSTPLGETSHKISPKSNSSSTFQSSPPVLLGLLTNHTSTCKLASLSITCTGSIVSQATSRQQTNLSSAFTSGMSGSGSAIQTIKQEPIDPYFMHSDRLYCPTTSVGSDSSPKAHVTTQKKNYDASFSGNSGKKLGAGSLQSELSYTKPLSENPNETMYLVNTQHGQKLVVDIPPCPQQKSERPSMPDVTQKGKNDLSCKQKKNASSRLLSLNQTGTNLKQSVPQHGLRIPLYLVTIVPAPDLSQPVPTTPSFPQIAKTPSVLQQVVRTPSSLQQIVQTPSSLQKIVQTPSSSQQIVQTSSSLQQIVPTPSSLQQIVQTPPSLQKIVKTPSSLQQIVQTPSNLQKIVPTPSSLQQIVQTPSSLQKIVQTPPGLQKIVQTPSTLQKIVPTPSSSQQVVQTPPSMQKIVQTPSLQQIVQNPSSLQKIVPSPSSLQQIVQTPSSLQKIVQTPPGLQKIVQTPSSLQKIVQTPPGLQKIVQTPPGLQQIVQTPSSLQKIVQTPPGLQQVVQTPSSLQKIVQTPPGLQQVVQTPSSLQKIVQTPPGLQKIVQTPPGLQQIVQNPSSLQQIVQTPSSLQQVVQTPSSLQEIVQTPSSLHHIIQTPSSLHQTIQNDLQQIFRNPSGLQKVVLTPSSCLNSSSVVLQSQFNTHSSLNNHALGENTQLVNPSGVSKLPRMPVLQLAQNSPVLSSNTCTIVQSNPIILGNNEGTPSVYQTSLGIQNTASHGYQGSVGNVAQPPVLNTQTVKVPMLGSGGREMMTNNAPRISVIDDLRTKPSEFNASS